MSDTPKKSTHDELIYIRRTKVLQREHDVMKTGTLVNKRYEITDKLGIGSHSMVFEAYEKEEDKFVALKVFKHGKRAMREMDILRKVGKYECFCTLFDHFILKGIHQVVVMELQGPTVSEIIQNFRPLHTGSVLKMGEQMLTAIEKLHSYGYVHCDIKPSNFAIGLPPRNSHRIILIDFSLSRTYDTVHNSSGSQKSNFGFIGTLKYASPNIHRRNKFSRRDDLWSLLFTMIDLRQELPWSHQKRDYKILSLKTMLAERLSEEAICKEFKNFKRHLDSLGENERPNYDKLRHLFEKIMAKQEIEMSHRFEWEKNPHRLWRVRKVEESGRQVEIPQVYRSSKAAEMLEAIAGPSHAQSKTKDTKSSVG